ncbi:MAG TPA: methyltransferase domain-containing protein [Desulfopila sp.]|nr:methyltransferase domain-containing protein [Desulfopila sp.]
MAPLRFRYQTIEFGDVDIHLRTLRNLQEYQDNHRIAENLGISSATWSLFGVIWPSSLVLAWFLHGYPLKGKRILEVGCGIGLVTLLLNHLQADVTATDYHPEAGEFLRQNVLLNNGKTIPFVRTSWADTADDGLGRFDLIVGSDLLYEAGYVDILSAFINRHARPRCEVVIVDPGRGNHSKFTRRMEENNYEHSRSKPARNDFLEKPFSGWVLQYRRSIGTIADTM